MYTRESTDTNLSITDKNQYYTQQATNPVVTSLVHGNIEEHPTYNDDQDTESTISEQIKEDHIAYKWFVWSNVFISCIQPALNSIAAFASMFLGSDYKDLSVSDFNLLMSALIESPISALIWVFAIGAFTANLFIGLRFLSSTIKTLYKEIIPYAFKEAPLDAVRFLRTGTTRQTTPLTTPLITETQDIETPLTEETILNLDKEIKLTTLPMRHPASLLAAFFGALTGIMYFEMSLEALTIGRNLIGSPWGWLIDGLMIFANTSVNTATRISGTVMLLSTFELWLPTFYTDYLLYPISTKAYSDSMKLYPELRNTLLFFHHLKCYAPYLSEQDHWEIVRCIEHNKFKQAAEKFYDAIQPLDTDLSFSALEPNAWPRLLIKAFFFTVSLLAGFLFYNIVDRATETWGAFNTPAFLFLLVVPSVCYYFITLGRNIDLLLSSYQWHKRAAIHEEKKGYAVHAHAMFLVLPAILICLLSAGNLLYVGDHDARNGDYDKFGFENKTLAEVIFSLVGGTGSSIVNFYSVMTILNKKYGPKPIDLSDQHSQADSTDCRDHASLASTQQSGFSLTERSVSEITNSFDRETVTIERHEDMLTYLKSLIGSTERQDRYFRGNTLWYTQKITEVSQVVDAARENHYNPT